MLLKFCRIIFAVSFLGFLKRIVASNDENVCGWLANHPNIGMLPSMSDCGYSSPQRNNVGFKIMGGENAGLGEFPWMALLLLEDILLQKGAPYCGGSIINERYVLTAAHCFKEYPNHISKKVVLNLRVGSVDSVFQILDVEEEISHPLYLYNTLEHDIGLVRLANNVKFNNYVSPICLPLYCNLINRDFVGDEVRMAGWGFSQDEIRWDGKILQSAIRAPVLQKVTMRVTPLETCVKKGGTTELLNTKICAGSSNTEWPGKNACQGDSGGPLMWSFQEDRTAKQYFEIGITSSASKCYPTDGYVDPVAYTRVSSYLDWILDTIRPYEMKSQVHSSLNWRRRPKRGYNPYLMYY